MSNTLIDERFKQNYQKAQLKSLKIGFLIIFSSIIIAIRLPVDYIAIFLIISISLTYSLIMFLIMYLLYYYDRIGE